MMVLTSPLPVPLIAPEPVRVRFSTSPDAVDKIEAHRRLNKVSSGARAFIDNVTNVVDNIGITAVAANKRVSACSAVQDVIAERHL